MMKNGDRRIGIAVITWNRRDEVLDTLGRLTQLPERPRIVVVDNASCDGTARAIARHYPGVTVVEAERNLGGAARNLAVERLECPYVAMCDDDCWWDPGTLRHAADVFDAHPRLAVACARVLVEPGRREDPTCLAMQHSPLPAVAGMPGPALLGFLAGASVVRRSAFLEAGGFLADLAIGGEEQWLAAELADRGWWLCYFASLCVHHRPSPQRDVPARRQRMIRNRLCFAWLRRPLASAVRQTLTTAWTEPWDRATLRGFAAGAAGVVRRLRWRRVVTADVERGLRLLEAPPARPIASAHAYLTDSADAV